MKKVIITVALLIGASAATPSFAENGMKIVHVIELNKANEVTIKALSEMKFRLTLDSTTVRTEVMLVDGNGDVLFNEYVGSAAGYGKVFDLSNLADGNYSFVIKNGSEKTTKPFEIKTSTERSVKF